MVANPLLLVIILLLLPLAGGIVAFASGNSKSPYIASFTLVIGFLVSVLLQFQEIPIVVRWQWVPGVGFGFNLDQLSLLLICLVYFISALVHLFSIYYMKGDPGIKRYYLMLGFFTTSMLGLLASDHLVFLFLFWELVGFSSYLLIGFWFKDVNKARDAREAFMINRVADAGLLIGVILLVSLFQLPYISELKQLPPGFSAQLAGLCLLIGALGKSAQFPFFGWLVKAMAGPTPVSALIHAATMVTAGVYLLVRMVPVLDPLVLNITAVAGAVTALIGGYSALNQHDIKKVLAYSTISQLGYMVLGVGVGAYQSSVFHLWTHAFFKAGLFLAAGAVIHFMHQAYHDEKGMDPQDMRGMGGLFKRIPITGSVFVVCGLALSGLPFFSGFLSKEGILSGAWIWAEQMSSSLGMLVFLVPFLAFLAALFTPFYIGRQILLVFFGAPRLENAKAVRSPEPTLLVRLPLVLLGLGSLWFFNALNPLNSTGWWLKDYLFEGSVLPYSGDFHKVEQMTMIISILLALGGLLGAYLVYKPGNDRHTNYGLAGNPENWYGKLAFDGWYIREFYQVLSLSFMKVVNFARMIDQKIIDPAINLMGVSVVVFSKFLGLLDREVVDGSVNLVALIARKTGEVVSRIQSAKIQNQVVWMVLSVLFLILWFQFRG